MTRTLMMTAGLMGLGMIPAVAQLEFSKTVMEVKAGPEQDEIRVEFPFVVGEKGAEIADYDAPCTCLEARISDNGRLKWKPGEKGAVQGIFKMGNFRGKLDKMIVMRMKGGEEPLVKLTVKMELPTLLEIEPKTLFWNQGEKPKSLSFKLTVNHDKPIHIVGTSGTNEQFPFEVKTIKDGWEYEIVVTPESLEERGFGLLRIKTDSKFAKHKSYQGFMAIRRAGSGAK
ncbi:MAG: hypothetical protein OSA48_05250 [Akkermansiaceae bacterium]|jgi:hypothetical protein|nr:hypothetical protein [Akkermansiaceae bacterium]